MSRLPKNAAKKPVYRKASRAGPSSLPVPSATAVLTRQAVSSEVPCSTQQPHQLFFAFLRCLRAVTRWTVVSSADVQFVFDLELPADFVPVPVDGEVECFELWDLERVCALIEAPTGGGALFKPNVCLVVIDFLIRKVCKNLCSI